MSNEEQDEIKELCGLVRSLAINQTETAKVIDGISKSDGFSKLKNVSTLLGLCIIVGSWIWFIATDHADLQKVLKVQERRSSHESDLNTIKTDLVHIKDDIKDNKRLLEKLSDRQ